MSQTIETTYVFRGGQAQQELQRLQRQEDLLGAASQKMAQGLAVAERALNGMQAGAKNLQQKLGPASSAITGMTSALGAHNGEAGKMVAGVGQLAAAFAQGGPYAAGLAAATIGVNALTQAWEESIAAQDRAIATANAGTDAAGALRRRVDADITNLRRQLGGPETGAEARGRVQGEIDDVQRRRDEIVRQRNALKVGTDGYDEARQRLEAERTILEAVLERLQLKQGLAGAAADKGNKPAGRAGTVQPAGDGDVVDDWKGRALERAAEEQKLQESLAKQKLVDALANLNREAKAKEDLEAAIFANERAAYEEQQRFLAEIDAGGFRRREEQAKANAAALGDVVTQSTSVVAGASQQLIADLITQQDHAAERFGLTIMQQAGQALVSYGVQAIGRGVLEASSPVTAPLAPASFTAGGLLVAAGVGLGGVAAGIGASLGSGGGGGSGDARSVVSPSRRASSSNGPAVATNNTFNLRYGGPFGKVAEDVARDTLRAQERARRRGRRR